jgi:hypothetical protein
MVYMETSIFRLCYLSWFNYSSNRHIRYCIHIMKILVTQWKSSWYVFFILFYDSVFSGPLQSSVISKYSPQHFSLPRGKRPNCKLYVPEEDTSHWTPHRIIQLSESQQRICKQGKSWIRIPVIAAECSLPFAVYWGLGRISSSYPLKSSGVEELPEGIGCI